MVMNTTNTIATDRTMRLFHLNLFRPIPTQSLLYYYTDINLLKRIAATSTFLIILNIPLMPSLVYRRK
jgi:hypothetical protein